MGSTIQNNNKIVMEYVSRFNSHEIMVLKKDSARCNTFLGRNDNPIVLGCRVKFGMRGYNILYISSVVKYS